MNKGLALMEYEIKSCHWRENWLFTHRRQGQINNIIILYMVFQFNNLLQFFFFYKFISQILLSLMYIIG